MTKYFVGIIGSLLALLSGVWLVLAPSALAYQPQGAAWINATYADFWTGLPLLVVSLVGLVMYALGLVEELKRRGILERRPLPQAQQVRASGMPAGSEVATSGSSSHSSNIEQVLLPMVEAMLKDMRDRRQDGEQNREWDLGMDRPAAPNIHYRSPGSEEERSTQ